MESSRGRGPTVSKERSRSDKGKGLGPIGPNTGSAPTHQKQCQNYSTMEKGTLWPELRAGGRVAQVLAGNGLLTQWELVGSSARSGEQE